MEINLNGLSYRYPHSARAALSDINARISPGMHLLLGENGAGKTTLLHLIAGLLFPTEGCCTVNDCPTRLRLPSIGSRMFFTGTGLELPAHSMNELARIHAQFYPRFSPERLRENLTRFGIEGSEKLRDLSLGNMQKAKIAYALALNTEILLLDEPANGLDIQSKRIMQKMLAEQTGDEQTVIVSTHSVADLEHLYDGVIDLSHGRLLYALKVDELLRRVRFAVSDAKPADAIYSEMRIGRYHSIIANSGDNYSEPDYQLLYLAMRNPEGGPRLLSLLNNDTNT